MTWNISYNTSSQIRFKTSMLRTSLCDYRHAYVLVKGTITVAKNAAAGADTKIPIKRLYLKIVL